MEAKAPLRRGFSRSWAGAVRRSPVPRRTVPRMKLHAELESTGGNTAGFRIPDDAVRALGGGKQPKVVATVNGFTWRSSIARRSEAFWLGMSIDRRSEA